MSLAIPVNRFPKTEKTGEFVVPGNLIQDSTQKVVSSVSTVRDQISGLSFNFGIVGIRGNHWVYESIVFAHKFVDIANTKSNAISHWQEKVKIMTGNGSDFKKQLSWTR